jgi:nucleotide-binding universal stress UspA family protein
MENGIKACMYERILFATDFSDSSTYALSHAISLAKICGAKLYIVHVIYDMTVEKPHIAHPAMNLFYQEMINEAYEELDRTYGPVLKGFERVEKIVIKGAPPSNVINDFARDNKADLIVIGSVGRSGLEKLFFGNTADKVIRRAPCPVLVVRTPEHKDKNQQKKERRK